MLLSSEILYWQGVFAVVIAGATLPFCTGLEWQSCRSRRTCANGQFGFSKNLGGPDVSSVDSRLELPGYQLQASAVHSSAEERTQRVNVEVPPTEGNEVRRDGRQEVIAS